MISDSMIKQWQSVNLHIFITFYDTSMCTYTKGDSMSTLHGYMAVRSLFAR